MPRQVSQIHSDSDIRRVRCRPRAPPFHFATVSLARYIASPRRHRQAKVELSEQQIPLHCRCASKLVPRVEQRVLLPHQSLAPPSCSGHVECQAFACKLIHHGEHLKGCAACQCVFTKIIGPNMAWVCCFKPCQTRPARSWAANALNLYAFLLPHTPDALVIDHLLLAYQCGDTPVTIARIVLCQFAYLIAQFTVIGIMRLVAKSCVCKRNEQASAMC